MYFDIEDAVMTRPRVHSDTSSVVVEHEQVYHRERDFSFTEDGLESLEASRSSAEDERDNGVAERRRASSRARMELLLDADNDKGTNSFYPHKYFTL